MTTSHRKHWCILSFKLTRLEWGYTLLSLLYVVETNPESLFLFINTLHNEEIPVYPVDGLHRLHCYTMCSMLVVLLIIVAYLCVQPDVWQRHSQTLSLRSI
jgi:hypothetical protein